MKITIEQIAKKAGVSIATISRAANPQTRSKVASDTLLKVDQLFKKYAYTPNLAARNLRGSSTKTIGVVIPFFRDLFFSTYHMHFLTGVLNALEGTGYQFKLLALSQEQQKWDQYDFRSGEQVDGLIVSLWFKCFSGKKALENIRVPTVVIDDYEEGMKTMFIGGDHLKGGMIAAEYLYSHGHRHVGIITGPEWSRDCRARSKGFLAYWKRKGLVFNKDLVLSTGNLHRPDANRAFDQILEIDPKVTAIFCCTDNMAGGVLERMKELKLACPKDISVLGYDDDFIFINRFPFLTSIQAPVYEAAQKAAWHILGHLKSRNNKNVFVGKEFLPVRLVERQSVKKLS